MKKKIFIFISVVFVVSVVILLFLLRGSYFFVSTDKVVIGPKWVNQAQFAGIFSAKERGIYRQHNLTVDVKEFDFETNQYDDLMNGETDFAIVSAEEFLLLVDDGAPIKAIAAIYQTSPYAVVSLSNENIETPADFKDKILGKKGGKIEEEIVYGLLLSSVGLTLDDVEMVNLGFDNSEYIDLISGKADVVDLYRTDQLYFFDKKALDYDIIYPEHFGTSTFNDIIISKNDFIEKNPEIVKNFIVATMKGWEYVLDNPENAVEDTLKHVTNDSYKDYDYESFILKQSIPLLGLDSGVSIGSMTYNQWNNLYAHMLERGFVSENLVIKDIFTTEFLP